MNLCAIDIANRFISYLKYFPLQNHFEVASALFWPLLEKKSTIYCLVPQKVQLLDFQVMHILILHSLLSHVMETSCFGPHSEMPRGHHICGCSKNIQG